jgi:hypothetical protein
MNKIENFIEYLIEYTRTNYIKKRGVFKTNHNLTRYDITFEEMRENFKTLDLQLSQHYKLYRINFTIDMNNDVLLIIEIYTE